MPESPVPEVLAALFGLLIGSFLNVCIYRWTRDLSVVAPRSRCPRCGRGIAWHDNVPVLSFLALRGRCRHCRAPISWRYPTVELLTAGCFAAVAARHGFTLDAAKYCVFSAILIGLIFSDLEVENSSESESPESAERLLILPDQFTIGGFFVGLAFAPFVKVPDSTFTILADIAGLRMGPRAASFAEAALGGLLPAFVLWALGWLFEKLRHKEGLGFGDVKMIAMIGAFIGIQGTLFTVIAGSVLGSVIGLAWIGIARKDAATYQLPFGTFLGAAALFAALMNSTHPFG